MFMYIHSLLIDKDPCECQNVSINFPCVSFIRAFFICSVILFIAIFMLTVLRYFPFPHGYLPILYRVTTLDKSYGLQVYSALGNREATSSNNYNNMITQTLQHGPDVCLPCILHKKYHLYLK
jgi:hypothetical protein